MTHTSDRLKHLSGRSVAFTFHEVKEKIVVTLTGQVAEKYTALLDRAVIGASFIRETNWRSRDKEAVRGIYDIIYPRLERTGKSVASLLNIYLATAFGSYEGDDPIVFSRGLWRQT